MVHPHHHQDSASRSLANDNEIRLRISLVNDLKSIRILKNLIDLACSNPTLRVVFLDMSTIPIIPNRRPLVHTQLIYRISRICTYTGFQGDFEAGRF